MAGARQTGWDCHCSGAEVVCQPKEAALLGSAAGLPLAYRVSDPTPP